MALKASMKILIIGTNAPARQSIKKLLSDIGFRNVKEAIDGQKALLSIQEAITEKTPVEFIISEFELDKMNVVELMTQMKNDGLNKGTKLLLVTSDSDHQKMIQAINSGVNAVVVKPFSANILKEKIAKIFNQ